MSSIYGKMDDCRISDLTKGLLELRLNSESGYVKTELEVEWPCSVIHISFNWWLCHHGASNSYLMTGGGDGVGSDSGSEDDSVRSIGLETLAFFFGGPVLDFWPLEELALAMVSGTRRGRGGSEVEPWTGVSLGILRLVDGDEDLAPRVLAMAVSAKTACSGGGGEFRHRFRSPFRSYETSVRRCKVALLCQRVVSQLQNTLRNGVSAAKRWISRRGKFAAISQLRNGCTWLRNGTRVPRGLFATAKIFAEGARRLKWFRSGNRFSQRGGDFRSGS
ncbi:hypothetical protein AAG906_038432 [Vitis piasezkii]